MFLFNILTIISKTDKNVLFDKVLLRKEINFVKHLFYLNCNSKSCGYVKLECKLKQNQLFQLMKFVYS